MTMTEAEFQALVRDPGYYLNHVDAIARGERPADIRTPKPKEFIARGDPDFRRIVIEETAAIAAGKLVIL